jgi:hypothetical protein
MDLKGVRYEGVEYISFFQDSYQEQIILVSIMTRKRFGQQMNCVCIPTGAIEFDLLLSVLTGYEEH